MRLIDQALEVIGRTEATRWSEEVGDVIAVRTVVRVLLHRHNLERVVARRDDVGQSLRAKLLVARHAHLLATHPYVALIDEQGVGTLRCWRLH